MKKIITMLLASVLSVAAVLGLTACEKITAVKVTVSVYTSNTEQTEKEIEIKLYGHLAPETVEHVKALIGQDYYTDAVFYTLDGYSSQLMLGDLKYKYSNDAKEYRIVQNEAQVTAVKGEFTKNGVQGSDLINEKYSVGLWRLFDKNSSVDYGSDTGRVYDSGKGLMYFPTTSLSAYDGNFCVFGRIEDEDAKEAFDDVMTAVNDSENYLSYTVYYTGTDVGSLVWNIAETSKYEEMTAENEIADLFEPEAKSADYMYAPYKINVLKPQKRVVIKSATI